MFRKSIILSFCAFLPLVSVFAAPAMQPGTRYATDAYPGFDREDQMLSPSKKTPSWFSWFYGPSAETATEQLAYCRECLTNESFRAARIGYEALVAEWPTAPEAPIAQKELADLYLGHYQEYDTAFNEYRYLLDFYSAQCDYDEIAKTMYQVAELMRDEGKRVLFFRFANTIDVRRAYEALVLRAPGAKFAPQAMLTIASLREDEGSRPSAIKVYENLRNLYPGTPEALKALYGESRARIKLLRECEYNRSRCQDTIDFFKQVLSSNRNLEGREDIEQWLKEASGLIESEAFQAAKFYDSRTRTRRSAINAYKKFLEEYPASSYAAEARQRVAELEGGQ